MEKILLHLLELDQPIDVFFHGGEPMLAGKSFFEKAVQILNNHPAGHNVHIGIQTNGTLIDDAWASFFALNNFSVGVSIDGDESLHNMNRVTLKNVGTYKAALSGWQLLKKHSVNAGVITVFTNETANNVMNADRIFNHFRSLGISRYDVHPSLTPRDAGGVSSLFNVTPLNYAAFMSRFFMLWLEAGDENIQIRFIEDFLHNMAGLGTFSCYSSGKCTHIAGIDPDGSVSPCTRPFKENFNFGNAVQMQMDTIFSSAAFEKFFEKEATGRAATKLCSYAKLCGHGGCPHERLNQLTNQQDITGRHIYCTCSTNTNGGYPALFFSMIMELSKFLRLSLNKSKNTTTDKL